MVLFKAIILIKLAIKQLLYSMLCIRHFTFITSFSTITLQSRGLPILEMRKLRLRQF